MPILTVFPDPSSGATSTDGQVFRGSVDETLAVVRSGTGTGHDVTNTVAGLYLSASATSNQYVSLSRFMMTFDTSALTSSAVITSATLSFFMNSVYLTDLGVPSFSLVAATPAVNNDLANSDYSQVGSTRLASDLLGSSLTDQAYNDFTLNASGLANINKTGVSGFAIRLSWDVDGSGPVWSSGVSSGLRLNEADAAGTNTDPKLTITYTLPNPTIHPLYIRSLT